MMRRRGSPACEEAERLPTFLWDEAIETLLLVRTDGTEDIIFSGAEAPSDPRWLPGFSRWYRWTERQRYIENRWDAGVYVLARFPQGEPAAAAADPLDEAVVYIGETCNRTLDTRWREFDNSAFQRRNGHSGGWEYCRRYVTQADTAAVVEGALGAASALPKKGEAVPTEAADVRAGLYVAAFTVTARVAQDADAETLRLALKNASAFIRYAERRLLWEYVLTRRAYPRGNRR